MKRNIKKEIKKQILYLLLSFILVIVLSVSIPVKSSTLVDKEYISFGVPFKFFIQHQHLYGDNDVPMPSYVKVLDIREYEISRINYFILILNIFTIYIIAILLELLFKTIIREYKKKKGLDTMKT